MKLLTTNILIILFSISVFSQNDAIENIKKQYYEISNNQEDYNIHKVELNSILPAVGPKTKVVSFYHKSVQANPEIDPYDMMHKLYKVTVSYNISAHSSYSCEYLYNKKGDLIFYFDKLEGDYENYQKRFYFNDNKLIKCIIQSQIEGEDQIKYSKTSSFKKEDLSNSKAGIIDAGKYYQFFKQLEVLDEID